MPEDKGFSFDNFDESVVLKINVHWEVTVVGNFKLHGLLYLVFIYPIEIRLIGSAPRGKNGELFPKVPEPIETWSSLFPRFTSI